MKLNVPEVLKVLLVDDWEAVTKNSHVCLICSKTLCCVSHLGFTVSAPPETTLCQ